ncbi:MAG: hypothetical protein ACPLZH_01285 [Minisyncoccales bacterium]
MRILSLLSTTFPFVNLKKFKINFYFFKFLFFSLLIFSFSLFSYQFFIYSKDKLFLYFLKDEIKRTSLENEDLEMRLSQISLSEKLEEFVKKNNFVKKDGKKIFLESIRVIVKK